MVIIKRNMMCYMTTDYSSVTDASVPEMTDQLFIYYGGFGLISLQIFMTTTKFCLKTFPLSLAVRVWWWFKETLSRLFEIPGFCNSPVGRERFLPPRAKASSTPTLMHMSTSIHSNRGYQTHIRPQRGNMRIFQSVHWASFMKNKRFLCKSFLNPFLRKLTH